MAVITVLERILQLKDERGWTEYRLSEESGISQTTISSWFKKNIYPSIPSLMNICEAFHISLSEFFAFDNSPIVISDRQRELLDNWNKLTIEQQDIILKLLKSM